MKNSILFILFYNAAPVVAALVAWSLGDDPWYWFAVAHFITATCFLILIYLLRNNFPDDTTD